MKWEKIGKIPWNLWGFASWISYPYIYVYGGTNGISFLSTLIRFSLIDKKWEIYVGILHESLTHGKITASCE